MKTARLALAALLPAAASLGAGGAFLLRDQAAR